MNNHEVRQIIVMVVFALVILLVFIGALWLGLKLGLSSQEATIELKGADNGKYERF